MELFNEMFSVDCSRPVKDSAELDSKHFLRIGSLYLWVQRRSAMSAPHAHAYYRGVRRVKAGMTSPDERDKRLYEKYCLCDYELPFVCLVMSEQKKNSFTIVLHDYRGTLAQEDRHQETLLRQFESSLQPSQLPTPIVEEGEAVSQSASTSGSQSAESPVTEAVGELVDSSGVVPSGESAVDGADKSAVDGADMSAVDGTEDNSIPIAKSSIPIAKSSIPEAEDNSSSALEDPSENSQWESFVLSHHLVEIQNKLELKLFEAKNKMRMQKLLAHREMDSTALVDATRCRLPLGARRRPNDSVQVPSAPGLRRPVLPSVSASGHHLRRGVAGERALAAAASRGRPQRLRGPAHSPPDGVHGDDPLHVQRAVRGDSPAPPVVAGRHRRPHEAVGLHTLRQFGRDGGFLAHAGAGVGLGRVFGGLLRDGAGAAVASRAAVSAGASPAVVRGGAGARGVAADAAVRGEQVATAGAAGGGAGESAGDLCAGRVSVALLPRAGRLLLRGAAPRGDGGDGRVSADAGESVRAPRGRGGGATGEFRGVRDGVGRDAGGVAGARVAAAGKQQDHGAAQRRALCGGELSGE